MKIIDLDDKEIPLPIWNWRSCRQMLPPSDPSFKQLDEELQAYWEDVYEKLLGLKNE